MAGEKQPTLEISHSSSATGDNSSLKKPKDAIYYNYFSKLLPSTSPTTMSATSNPTSPINANSAISPVTATPQQQQQQQQQATNVVNPIASNLPQQSVSPQPPIGSISDKENYYNSSRRENLSSNEYRNSYKDHYDSQGVRLNPAIFKSLTHQQQAAAAAVIANMNIPHHSNAMPITGAQLSSSSSPITITKSSNVNVGGGKKSSLNKSNVLNDHTYKAGTSINNVINYNKNNCILNQQNSITGIAIKQGKHNLHNTEPVQAAIPSVTETETIIIIDDDIVENNQVLKENKFQIQNQNSIECKKKIEKKLIFFLYFCKVFM